MFASGRLLSFSKTHYTYVVLSQYVVEKRKKKYCTSDISPKAETWLPHTFSLIHNHLSRKTQPPGSRELDGGHLMDLRPKPVASENIRDVLVTHSNLIYQSAVDVRELGR